MLRLIRRRVDLAVLVNGFPRLSETFVLQELLELERQGLRLHVIALRRPEEIVQQEALRELEAEVEYLPDLADAAPGLAARIAHAALFLRRPLTYLHALAEITPSPDFSTTGLRRSAILAHRLVRLGSPPLYVHFANRPATLGRFAALLAGVPYGLSAHAKDIWLTPEDELRRKVRDAEVVLCCTSEARARLARLAGDHTPVRLVYHGVDTRRPPQPAPGNAVPLILSVGRLVEKKGHATLIQAAALLRERGLDFELRLGGEGPEWPALQRLVHELGVADRVQFLGPLNESEVRAELGRADLFALACQELPNGDRDGIPNVILEAMAHGLPVVSTTCSGVAEAVVHGQCGLLVPQRDPAALADALAAVLEDGALRRRLGEKARARVVGDFDRAKRLPAVGEALRAAGLVPATASAKASGEAGTLEAVA
jgi:glycosyltransferase involved in cell wall biosynthesis